MVVMALAIGTVSVACLPVDPAVSIVPANVDRTCRTDVTAPLNAWLASVPDSWTARFQGGGCFRIDGTLRLTDRSNLVVDGDGAVFWPGIVGGGGRVAWRLVGGTRVTLENMTINGANPHGLYDPSLESQHGVEIQGTTYVDINHTIIKATFGDFIYFAASKTAQSTGYVHQNTLTTAGRNGVTVVAGSHITIDHNSISHVTYAMIDLEPSHALAGAFAIIIDSNTFGPGARYMVGVITTYGSVHDVVVTNNRLAPNMMMSWRYPTSAPNPFSEFSGNGYDV
jgi:hypothetical protein